MIIGIERAKNKIYDRIVQELVRGFREFGHECVVVELGTITSIPVLHAQYARCDWVISSHPGCFLLQKIDGVFLFELLPYRMIFLHHDALSNHSTDLADIQRKVDAFVRIKDRSMHFSIEQGDVEALQQLGIPAFPIYHINTMGKVNTQFQTQPERDVSFIGHALPPVHAYIAFGADDQQYFASYRARLVNFRHSLRDDYAQLHASKYGQQPFDSAALSGRIQYLLFANNYTMWMRGDVLQHLPEWRVDLYGGDPAWLHDMEQSRFFTEPHIISHKPVFDTTEVAHIFENSKINLNITSLQFDSALINRVIDGFAAGGFFLTDYKAQLLQLTPYAELIMYSSIEELRQKIHYFIQPEHQAQRIALIYQIQQDLAQNCTVERTVAVMLEKMG